jgi:hypothetical protein
MRQMSAGTTIDDCVHDGSFSERLRFVPAVTNSEKWTVLCSMASLEAMSAHLVSKSVPFLVPGYPAGLARTVGALSSDVNRHCSTFILTEDGVVQIRVPPDERAFARLKASRGSVNIPDLIASVCCVSGKHCYCNMWISPQIVASAEVPRRGPVTDSRGFPLRTQPSWIRGSRQRHV